MDRTTNYGLAVTDDDHETFYDFRTALAAVTGSNMQIIDEALAAKVDGFTVNADGTIQLTSQGNPVGSPIQLNTEWATF